MKSIWAQFDQSYIINLKSSRSRLKHARKEFSSVGIDNYTVLEATDGKHLDIDLFRQSKFCHVDDYKKRHLSAGEVGCYMSHVRVWLDMISKGYKKVLICEDDMRFDKGSLPYLDSRLKSIPDDWSIIHFYCSYAGNDLELRKQKRRPFSEGVYFGWDEGGGTVCYGLSDKAALMLLEHAFPIRYAADGLVSYPTLDQFQELAPELYKDKGFVLDPSPCCLADFETTIDGREESNGVLGQQSISSGVGKLRRALGRLRSKF